MNRHIIVGGGINGLLTAYYLIRSGEKVTIIDQGEIGKESSWAGGGILSPLYPWRYADSVTSLANWSQAQYPSLVQHLFDETGTDPQYVRCGMLTLNVDDKTAALNWSRTHDQTAIELNSTQCREQFTELAESDVSGIWMSRVGQVRNPRLVKSLRIWLENNGATILANEKVLDLLIEKHSVTGVRTINQTLNGDSVCIAAGAWAKNILHKLEKKPDISPVKGQMLLLQSTPDLVNYIVLKDSHYIIPRKDGRILVGSTLEYVGFDKSTTVKARSELLEIAYSILPKLKKCKLEKHWAGLRPGSKNGIPTICQHPDISGLYINGGQFRNGVVLAPASAQLMTNIILRQGTICSAKPFRLA
jgi:glycine oxidase